MCFVTHATFEWSRDEARCTETDGPVTTRVLHLCRQHEAELLDPLLTLAHPVQFATAPA